MKTSFLKTFAALVAAAYFATFASAQITLFEVTMEEPEPTENVIFDGVFEEGGSVATLINATAVQGARGGNFVIGAAGTESVITGFTFQANLAQTFGLGSEMTAVIFAGTDFTGVSATDISPTGLAEAPGIDILYEETLQLPFTIDETNFLIVEFASSLTVDAGDTLGVMVFTNTEFSQIEGSNNGGGRLLYRPSDPGEVNASGSRDFRFSILGEGMDFVVGDVNCDGIVDLLDVQPFVDLITGGIFDVKGDINEDGAVDLLDVQPFVDILLGN